MHRVYPAEPLVGVGAVVFKEDCTLLIKRGKPPLFGTWSLPGGRLKPDENLKEAAAREVKEECSIDIEVLDLIKLFEFIQRDEQGKIKYHYIVFDFMALYKGGTLKNSSDALDARWVHLGDLCDLELTKDVVEAIEEGARGIPWRKV
jgi:ADP-ribose pyrophosphatase YjhB (NUDIX family)